MNAQDFPDPLPTPFDIAEIPVFKKPFPAVLVAALVLLAALALAAAWLYRRRKRNRTPEYILRAIRSDLETAVRSSDCPKGSFALCWKKLLRGQSLLGLHLDVISGLQEEAELQLYGPRYAPDRAREILSEALRSIEGISWKA